MYKLEWTFHLYDIYYNEKETEKREAYYDTKLQLLGAYKEKKEATLTGVINYNTDFKMYKVTLEELDINSLVGLLD